MATVKVKFRKSSVEGRKKQKGGTIAPPFSQY